jgi:dipeptidyl aminopeptidase/acylaminoacyl peptidase
MKSNSCLRLALAAVIAAAWPAPAAADGPTPTPARSPRTYTIEQFMNTTSVTGASFSADESRILFSSNVTGVFNVYSVPVAGGTPTPVRPPGTDTTFAVSYFRGDDRILFTRDQGGNELNHLYVHETDGQERDLTPGNRLKAAFQGWTPAGDAFYVTTNERDPKFFDLYRYDAKSYERRLVFKDDVGYQLGALSPDGRWLAFRKPRTQSEAELYLWDGQKAEMKRLSPEAAVANYSPQDFDADSRHLYYLSNEGGEFARVRRYDLAAGAHEDVEKAEWDVMYTSFSRRGRYRVTGINEDARTVIKVYDTRTGKTVALPPMPAGDLTSVAISPSETRMAFYLSGDRSPSNLYVYKIGDQEARRLTDTLSKDLDPADLVESSVARFKSFDAMTIPNILFKPHQATAARKAPALVWVHGGPGGQTRKGYNALIQYLVNNGYVVLGINNRGSSGYGRTFLTSDDLKHGYEPLWDCIEAKKYLASLPYVDQGRIGIIGGSYGGYMVLAALTLKPQEFAVGVDMFGISNWVRTLESIPSWWESQRVSLYKEIGDPVKDKEKLLAISPLFHADKVQRPLMVLQGANDPRVIKVESDDIVAAVKRNGVPVEYVVFPDEGHGFTKRENQIRGYRGILSFLNAHLKGAFAAPASSAP